jgi:hypothetical protein
MVADNGAGMDSDQLQHFATYSESVEDRGLCLDDDDSYSNLSMFGVGAKSAAFHLGDRMIVLTKSKNCIKIHRLVLDRFELVRKAKENENPYNFLYEHINPSSDVLPKEDELPREDICKDPSCMVDTVKKHIQQNPDQFTIILLRLKNPIGREELLPAHNRNIQVCASLYTKRETMHKALAEIYYFHLNPRPSVSAPGAIVKEKLFPREERNNRTIQ